MQQFLSGTILVCQQKESISPNITENPKTHSLFCVIRFWIAPCDTKNKSQQKQKTPERNHMYSEKVESNPDSECECAKCECADRDQGIYFCPAM